MSSPKPAEQLNSLPQTTSAEQPSAALLRTGYRRTAERDTGTKFFLGILFAVASFYAMVLLYHAANPAGAAVTEAGFLENCRQICLKYGLISTDNVRRDAEAYIRVVQRERLTESLAQILQTNAAPAASQQHPLLHRAAPAIELPDDRSQITSLQQLGLHRPLVVVFYLGYGCSHCVAQLVSLDIVAISADSPQHTSQRFQQYGRFAFSVLSDENRDVAAEWDVFHPATEQSEELMDHGTFIVDRNGEVIWAFRGREPFLDNRSLLQIIAKSQGLLPEPVARAK
jgi:peroxiredoxin